MCREHKCLDLVPASNRLDYWLHCDLLIESRLEEALSFLTLKQSSVRGLAFVEFMAANNIRGQGTFLT